MGWLGKALKKVAKIALPAAAAFIPGVGPGVAAALGGAGKLKTALSIAGGVAGAIKSHKQAKNANKIGVEANPFGQYRPGYGNQLARLMADPNAFAEDPGYQFIMNQGLDNTTRKMAASGYGGSGFMATELMKYAAGTAATYRGQELDRLGGFAGAGIMPASRASATQANDSSFDQLSSSLASIGYGVGREDPQAGGPGGMLGKIAYPSASDNSSWSDDYLLGRTN